jgi:putative phosphoesterase
MTGTDGMRLGVVSDTHGHLGNAQAAADQLSALHVDVVLHCGDIGSPGIVPLFASWPAHFVFGNVDQDEDDLRHAIRSAGLTCHDEFGRLQLEGVSIAFLHGDDFSGLAEAIASQDFDLICHGHTHRKRLEHNGRTLVLNPGALYRASPRSLATVELPSLAVEFHTIAN